MQCFFVTSVAPSSGYHVQVCHPAAMVRPPPMETADISICGACTPSVKVSPRLISDHHGSPLLTAPTSRRMHQRHNWSGSSHWLPASPLNLPTSWKPTSASQFLLTRKMYWFQLKRNVVWLGGKRKIWKVALLWCLNWALYSFHCLPLNVNLFLPFL